MMEDLKPIVEQSELAEEEKQDFLAVLQRAKPEERKELKALFVEDPGMVAKAYQNFKEKVAAFEQRDKKAWDKIMDEEKKMVEEADLQD